jgi:ABC-type uncharacterized transport system substrate-binding protein
LFAGSLQDAGGLISYGTNLAAADQRMAAYVDKILKGTNPGDLPVEAVKENCSLLDRQHIRNFVMKAMYRGMPEKGPLPWKPRKRFQRKYSTVAVS